MRDALQAGHSVLSSGGTALDAVTAAVILLEDDPVFNAGRGSVFSAEGTIEMDASIMRGDTREAGSVAGVMRIKNPILGARAVMEKSPHVMLAGPGADRFAELTGLVLAEPDWFHTERRWKQHRRSLKTNTISLDHADTENVYGTVGAVACDAQGTVAAASSTGGMVNKHLGRLGDTPVLGAGTWACNRSCATASTGHGEFFIRCNAAARVSALVELAGLSLEEAAQRVIHEEIAELGGDGGLITIDTQGRIALPFSTGGMFRGAIDASGALHTAIW